MYNNENDEHLFQQYALAGFSIVLFALALICFVSLLNITIPVFLAAPAMPILYLMGLTFCIAMARPTMKRQVQEDSDQISKLKNPDENTPFVLTFIFLFVLQPVSSLNKVIQAFCSDEEKQRFNNFKQWMTKKHMPLGIGMACLFGALTIMIVFPGTPLFGIPLAWAFLSVMITANAINFYRLKKDIRSESISKQVFSGLIGRTKSCCSVFSSQNGSKNPTKRQHFPRKNK